MPAVATELNYIVAFIKCKINFCQISSVVDSWCLQRLRWSSVVVIWNWKPLTFTAKNLNLDPIRSMGPALLKNNVLIIAENCLYRPVKEGEDCPIIGNSETTAVLESLDGLFSGLTCWSGWKMGETIFFGQNWAPKPQHCPKSISCELLVIESWLTHLNDWKTWFAKVCIPLRQLEVS